MTINEGVRPQFIREVKSVFALPWHKGVLETETITAGDEPQTVFTRVNLLNIENAQVGPDGLILARVREDGRVIDRRYRRSASRLFLKERTLLREVVKPA
jgi:hypothetical protein